MKVLVKYTEDAEPVNYECKTEKDALEFAGDECRWSNTEWVEIPEIGHKEQGDYA